LIAVGKREVDERSVSIRRLGAKGQKSASLDEAVRSLKAEAERIGELPTLAVE
jgi:threonyl-tRNA synthetase